MSLSVSLSLPAPHQISCSHREEEEDEMVNAMLSEKGMSSNLYSYNPETSITIDSLLEVFLDSTGGIIRFYRRYF